MPCVAQVPSQFIGQQLPPGFWLRALHQFSAMHVQRRQQAQDADHEHRGEGRCHQQFDGREALLRGCSCRRSVTWRLIGLPSREPGRRLAGTGSSMAMMGTRPARRLLGTYLADARCPAPSVLRLCRDTTRVCHVKPSIPGSLPLALRRWVRALLCPGRGAAASTPATTSRTANSVRMRSAFFLNATSMPTSNVDSNASAVIDLNECQSPTPAGVRISAVHQLHLSDTQLGP